MYQYIQNRSNRNFVSATTQTYNSLKNISGSPFVRNLIITSECNKRISIRNFPNLSRIIIQEGCDSVEFYDIPPHVTISIPASLRSINLPFSAEPLEDLYFEIDEDNKTFELIDNSLWKIGNGSEKDRLIWTDPSKNYLTFPHHTNNNSEFSTSYLHKVICNRNYFHNTYNIQPGFFCTIELTGKDTEFDLSHDPTIYSEPSNKFIYKIKIVEYVERLILPKGIELGKYAIADAPNLKEIIIPDSMTLNPFSIVDCPNLKSVHISRNVDINPTMYDSVTPFFMCPEINFTLSGEGPLYLENGILKSKEWPYIFHSNRCETLKDYFKDEIESNKLNENDAVLNPDKNSFIIEKNNEKWLFTSGKIGGRTDLSGLTDIYVSRIPGDNIENPSLIFAVFPYYTRKKITLHIPHGSEIDFLNIYGMNFFKDVKEESLLNTCINTIRMQMHDINLNKVGSLRLFFITIFVIAIIVILYRTKRPKRSSFLLFILLFILMSYSLYWITIFSIPEETKKENIALWLALSVSFTFSFWLLECNRHSFDPIKKLFSKSHRHIKKPK